MLQPGTVSWLREELRRGELSQAGLARGLCRRDGWRNPKGELCTASVRKALPGLAAQHLAYCPGEELGKLMQVMAERDHTFSLASWVNHGGQSRRQISSWRQSLTKVPGINRRILLLEEFARLANVEAGLKQCLTECSS